MTDVETTLDKNSLASPASPRYFVMMFLGVAAAAVVAYYPITGFFFELEDYLVFQASATKDGGLLSLWTPAWSNYLRPMEWLFHDLAYWLFGLNSQAQYTLSIAHQSLNAFLTGSFTLALTRNRNLAVITAILFAVYPTSWEAISWIAAAGHRVVLTYLLVTFIFAALHFRTGTIYTLVGMLVFFIASLATREQAILALPVIVLIHWYVVRTSEAPVHRRLTPYFWMIPIFAAYSLFQVLFQSGNKLVTGGTYGFGVESLSNLVHLTFNVFIPHGVAKVLLGPEFVAFAKAHWATVSLSVAVVAGLVLFLLSLSPATRRAATAFIRSPLTWFALAFIVVQISVYSLFLGNPNAASRYTYIAGLGGALVMANLLLSLQKSFTSPGGRFGLAFIFGLLLALNITNIRMGIETFRERTNAVESAMVAFAEIHERRAPHAAYYFSNPPYVGYAWAPAVAIRFGIPRHRLSAPPDQPEPGQLVLRYDENMGRFYTADSTSDPARIKSPLKLSFAR